MEVGYPILSRKTSMRYWLHCALLIIVSCALSNCATRVKKRDGAPNFYVDETRIPNATPKPEPLSRIGNKPSYQVFGKRYYVMRSCNNFEEVGTASWYGTMFHKRHTSSGEPYDMLGMTAAHKFLPLPTYVEVTNLANNRKVIVKVNDRGPFSGNRIIDLSYVAAKKLGMLGRGTAHVKIKAISFNASSFYAKKSAPTYNRVWRPVKQVQTIAVAHKQPISANQTLETKQTLTQTKQLKQMYLQVGAFKNRENALKLKNELSNRLSTPIKIINSTFANRLYRVQIGPILEPRIAEKITTQLHSLGIKPNKTYGA
ncbi:MAG: septal ring lytic transglycosylase RlpA family protein [Gammaproteobacteria bacterium]|nr:septal ring lytic transglycosylase RlpA family protein [Gammaproteobacteria bacterium]